MLMPPGGYELPPRPPPPAWRPGPFYWLRFAGLLAPVLMLGAFLIRAFG